MKRSPKLGNTSERPQLGPSRTLGGRELSMPLESWMTTLLDPVEDSSRNPLCMDAGTYL